MHTDKPLRIRQRLEEKFGCDVKITNQELRKAIDLECGYDIRTYKSWRKTLIRHGIIRVVGKQWITIQT